MPSWTGYYFKIDGLANYTDAQNTTQSAVSVVGPYTADDGAEDGTPSINGSDVVESFVTTGNLVFTIGGTSYVADSTSFGWELANGDMLFSLDFSGTTNQPIVDALNASGGTIDSVEYFSIFSNEFATPVEKFSLSTARYGGPMCFAKGTHILTPDGEKAVETLKSGDLVEVLDAPPQPIRWIGQSEFHFSTTQDRHKPILLPKNCLGPAQPCTDLCVSPQHGILIEESDGQFLVPALWLLGINGIRRMRGKASVSYFHLMLDRHQIVIGAGLASESFYPGPIALRMIGAENQQAIARAFAKPLQELVDGYGDRVRPRFPKARKQELASLIRRRQRDPSPDVQRACC